MNQIIRWNISIRLYSPNEKFHWAKQYGINKKQSEAVRWLFKSLQSHKIKLPLTVKLIRYGKKPLDSDNLVTAFKAIRDSIADGLIPGKAPGQADSSNEIKWEYAQEISKTYGVAIEFWKSKDQ